MRKAAKKSRSKKTPKTVKAKKTLLAERRLLLNSNGRLIERSGNGDRKVRLEAVTERRAPKRQHIEILEIVPGIELDKADAQVLYLPSLRELIAKVFDGDNQSLERLRLVHNLLLPKQSSHIERAMEVCYLMRAFSHIVEPSKADSNSLLHGAIKLRTDEASQRSSTYKLAKKFWRPKTTLKSLAVKAFIGTLPRSRAFEGINERSIERDLQKLREIDVRERNSRAHLEIALANGETLPYFFHTETWKRKKTESKL